MLSPILALPPCVNGHVTFPAPKAAFSGSVNPPCAPAVFLESSTAVVVVSAAEVGNIFRSIATRPPPPPYATSSGSRPIRTGPDYFPANSCRCAEPRDYSLGFSVRRERRREGREESRDVQSAHSLG
jgi:hypothetical protein